MEQIGYREIGRLAVPLIISQSVIIMGGLIDLAFIGPYGTEAIAAVSIANALCATIFNFLEGFRIGTTVLVAKAAAGQDAKKAAAIVNTGLFLVLLLGMGTLFAASGISQWVYSLADNAEIAYHGIEYLKIWLWTVPVILWSYVLTGLFRGLKDTMTPLLSTLVVCLLNIVFAYLFVYGGLGFPRLGVKGSALATLLANLVGLVLTAGLAVTRPLPARFIRLKEPFRQYVREYFCFAAEIGLNTGFTLLALLLFVYTIRQLGAAALAVHQITLQVFNFAYLPAMGFLITASILVPQLLEQGKEQLGTVVFRICRMSFGAVFITSCLLFMLAQPVSSFFSPQDQAVAEATVKTLRLVCIAQLFSSVYMVMRGTLTSCNDTRFIVKEGLFSGYLLFLPLAWLSVSNGQGVYGGYLAFLLWCATDCSLLVWRFIYLKRRLLKPDL